MPFERPELIVLRDTAYADIERIPGADARLAFGNLNVLAHINAGGVDSLHGYLEWMSKQLLPDTSEDEFLIRHASIWGVFRLDATPSHGSLAVTAEIGTTVVAGTQYVRKDGVLFEVTEEITLFEVSACLSVRALSSGAKTNTAAASAFTLVSPVAGLSSQATVSVGGLTNGADLEPYEHLRSRLLQRIQEPPEGGSRSDYVKWARQIAGVTRAWSYPLERGAGTVVVRFVRDVDADGGDGLIPDADAIEAVRAHIDEVRPVTAEVFVLPPVAKPLHFTIKVIPPTAAVKAAVEAELRDLIFRQAAPGQAILKTHITEAISISDGEHDHVLLSPASNVIHAASEMATFGSIRWV